MSDDTVLYHAKIFLFQKINCKFTKRSRRFLYHLTCFGSGWRALIISAATLSVSLQFLICRRGKKGNRLVFSNEGKASFITTSTFPTRNKLRRKPSENRQAVLDDVILRNNIEKAGVSFVILTEGGCYRYEAYE